MRSGNQIYYLCYIINIELFENMTIENFDKLRGYTEVNIDDLKVGDHLRYTSNKYKEVGRKISYGVVKSINPLMVNSYKDVKYPNWELDVSNKYKNIRLYIKKDKVYSGFCVDCNEKVDIKYEKCYTCLQQKNI